MVYMGGGSATNQLGVRDLAPAKIVYQTGLRGQPIRGGV